jgi:RecA-family ATPase
MAINWQETTVKEAMLDTDPTAYLIDGIIEVNSLNMFYGAPATGKSLLLQDMCVCASAGLPWLADANGKNGFKTTQCEVVWLNFDDKRQRLNKRITALVKGHEQGDDIAIHMFSPGEHFDLSSMAATEDLIDFVSFAKGGLMVIDTLSCLTGETDENSAAMKFVMANLRYICNVNQMSIILSHHQTKGRKEGRLGDSLRGHSSIEASLDLAINVKKITNGSLLTPTKVRGEEIAYEITARFDYTTIEGTRDMETARFFGSRTVERHVKSTVSLERVMLDILRDSSSPMNVTDTLKATYDFMKNHGEKVSEAQIRKEYNRLLANNILIKNPTNERNTYYLSIQKEI